MRKLLLLAFALGGFATANAQAINEIKLNIFNTIAIASVEVGYEHFIDKDQSIGVDLMINDRFSYFPESKSKGKKFNTNSVAASYNFYFGGKNDENGAGFAVSPFLKYRFGDFKEDVIDSNLAVVQEETKMSGFIIGVGVGYKWVRNDAFTVQPYVNIGRNFSQEVNDRFWAIEPNAGVTLGYRF